MTRKTPKSPADGQKPKAAPKPRKGGQKPASKAATAAAAPSMPSSPSDPSPASSSAPAQPETKRGVGRPTKYDPVFCDVVIDLGMEGKSLTQMACKVGVLKETMMDWTKKHPEFSAAVSMAMQYSQSWWEDLGQKGVSQGRDFNGFAYGFNMKNRFKHEYSDKVEVKHDATAAFAKIWQAVGTGKLEGATL